MMVQLALQCMAGFSLVIYVGMPCAHEMHDAFIDYQTALSLAFKLYFQEDDDSKNGQNYSSLMLTTQRMQSPAFMSLKA